MADFEDQELYGDRWAAIYDDRHAGLDPADAVGFLAALAGDGCALELAIGTGRIALPLAAAGVPVQGVDISSAMVAQLAAKPGGTDIPVTIGDMADVPVAGPFRLVYVVFNSLSGLPSSARQVDCFRNVARVLEPGGVFVIECFVPDIGRFDRGQRVRVESVTADGATIALSRHDLASQRITMQLLALDEQGARLFPIALRYAWPNELDLMAELAGLRLRNRYGGWHRQPFDSDSRTHISVYARPGD